MHVIRPELTSVHTSGEASLRPYSDRHGKRTNDKICRLIVGGGFIRPEVTSLCVNARYPTRIDERAYLGRGKPASTVTADQAKP
ncbi:MAG: hypothetical protein FWG87_11115 [Defluviitaleaceae bacterium]|nr:hypothetical protein [Defluviitaleaceae bacterium]